MLRVAGGMLLAVGVVFAISLILNALAPKYVLEWYDPGMTSEYSAALHNTLVEVGSTLPADTPREAAWRPVSNAKMPYSACQAAQGHYVAQKVSETGSAPLVRCVRAH